MLSAMQAAETATEMLAGRATLIETYSHGWMPAETKKDESPAMSA
jgi:hypothetical protein